MAESKSANIKRPHYEPPKETRKYPVQQGGCPACEHLMYDISATASFCPCEDCHEGGYVKRTGVPLAAVS